MEKLRCEHGEIAGEYCGECAIKKTSVKHYYMDRNANRGYALIRVSQIATSCKDYGIEIISIFYDDYRKQYVLLLFANVQQHVFLGSLPDLSS